MWTDAVYYAHFKKQGETTQAKITYIANNGGNFGIDGYGKEIKKVEVLVDPDSETDVTGVTVNSNAGYDFVGWTDEADNPVEGDVEFKAPRGDDGKYHTGKYYVSFEEQDNITINYKVFVENGSDADAAKAGSVNPTSETLAPATGWAKGSTVTVNPGYVFKGWYESDKTTLAANTLGFTPPKPESGAYEDGTTYYAKFSAKPNVKLTYKANAGGNFGVDDSSNEIKTIEKTIAPNADDIETVVAQALPGYHFVNWTVQNAVGSFVQVGSLAEFVPDKDPVLNEYVTKTYYANFAANPDVTINYRVLNNYGGTVNVSSETGSPSVGPFNGSTATAYQGYHFVRWQNDEGEEVDPTVEGGTTFKPEKDPVEFVYKAGTYYAVFAENDDVTIKYEAKTITTHTEQTLVGGTVDPTSEDLAPATGVATGSFAEVKPGFTFKGWYDKNNNQITTNARFAPSKLTSQVWENNTTYYAWFEENPDVTYNYIARFGGTVTNASDQNVSS